MKRSKRDLYTLALDSLMRGRMAHVLLDRDFELLAEIARLAQQDAPKALATTDPALFRNWRDAVTRYHLGGWGNMEPDDVLAKGAAYLATRPQWRRDVAPEREGPGTA